MLAIGQAQQATEDRKEQKIFNAPYAVCVCIYNFFFFSNNIWRPFYESSKDILKGSFKTFNMIKKKKIILSNKFYFSW